ncbi:ABC transporter permease [Natrinema longum]|uniref:ABC transporter permease n=1 Tax=Natrinema longum TaxID=370324 RepID=UPI001CC93198|nr:ABC transporter permease [Natrinema longum]MBZ6496960.1 ABC transporter permease [Natrinema longum]
MSVVSNLADAWGFLSSNFDQFIRLLRQHLELVLISEGLAIAIALPMGVIALRNERAKGIILGIGNVAQTIPPLAVIALVFPFLGLGFKPSVVALFIYALLPILTNTIAGLDDIEPEVIEAARGMGMTEREILRKVRFPLAVPVIFAGIRTSVILNVGTAYLAFFIGAGGLGVWVISGINLFQIDQMLAGAIPGAILAITLDSIFGLIERRLGKTSSIDALPS